MFDLVVLLAISLVAEGVAFCGPQGRAVICADSVQYVAAAEALLTADQTPHFELRKPGYPLFLAGLKLLFGQLGWVAIVANHVLLLLLPLAAYGFGVNLHSRLLGWIAAGLTIVQVQTAVPVNRMMSEVLFTFLLSFGLLAFVGGVRRPRAAWWLVLSGTLVGAAWLTRGVAVAVIPVLVFAVVVIHWSDRRRMMTLCSVFALSLVFAALVECSLNYRYSGRFRPSTGTAGAALCCARLASCQGVALPPTTEGKRLLALLPERQADEAFVANIMDQWVARYRAVQDEGMTDWEYDDLCRGVALRMIRDAPASFAWWTGRLAVCHLLRGSDWLSVSPVPASKRRGVIQHPAAPTAEEGELYWYAYFGLPYLTLDESVQLSDRVNREAAQRAPFGGSQVWATLAYWKKKPLPSALLELLGRIGNLWPGFALALCGMLGLNRTTCGVLAGAYILEALLIGSVTITDSRYQFVWLVSDTTLAAALPTIAVVWAARYVRARSWRSREGGAIVHG